jgi:hypothetical protein
MLTKDAADKLFCRSEKEKSLLLSNSISFMLASILDDDSNHRRVLFLVSTSLFESDPDFMMDVVFRKVTERLTPGCCVWWNLTFCEERNKSSWLTKAPFSGAC